MDYIKSFMSEILTDNHLLCNSAEIASKFGESWCFQVDT